MFDNSVLNVVIGLVFIFLLYSLLATAIQEAISNLLQRRSNMLFYGIRSMLTNTKNNNEFSKFELLLHYLGKSIKAKWRNLKSYFQPKGIVSLNEKFYNHPILKNYGQNSLFNKPSYLSAQNFSQIIIETIKNLVPGNESKVATFKLIKEILENYEVNGETATFKAPVQSTVIVATPALPSSPVPSPTTATSPPVDLAIEAQEILTSPPNVPASPQPPPIKLDKETLEILNFHLNEAAGDLDVFKYRLEKWFNDSMDRVSGWYKKNTHYWLFGIGLFLAVALNIDTIEISNFLSKNKVAAEQLAKMGEAAAANPGTFGGRDSIISKTALDSIKKDMQTVNTLVGLGWGDYGRSDTEFINSLKEKCWIRIWRPFVIPLADTFSKIESVVKKKAKDSVRNYVKQVKKNSEALPVLMSTLATVRSNSDSLKMKAAVDSLNTIIDRPLIDWAKIDSQVAKNNDSSKNLSISLQKVKNKTDSLKTRVAIDDLNLVNKHLMDSIKVDDSLVMQTSGALQRLLNSLPSGKNKADSLKLSEVVDRFSLVNNRLLMYSTKVDSFALLAFYNSQFKGYPFRLKTAYIFSKINTGQKFFGFLITAIAIGLGAPFWFDLLNKFVKLRSAGTSSTSSTTTSVSNTTNGDQIEG